MQNDRVFGGNTNSDLYLWEPVNRTDDQDFEKDLIASTNEITYNRLHLQTEKMAQLKQTHLTNPYAGDIIQPGEIPSFLDDQHDEFMIDKEAVDEECDLDLDLSNFLEDLRQPFSPEDAEIFLGERESCCGDKESAKDCDLDSTFISYLPEPEHSMEVLPFDHTFDNMEFDLAACEKQTATSNILKRAFSRSRFASDVNSTH